VGRGETSRVNLVMAGQLKEIVRGTGITSAGLARYVGEEQWWGTVVERDRRADTFLDALLRCGWRGECWCEQDGSGRGHVSCRIVERDWMIPIMVDWGLVVLRL